jgi:hypothetical protein
MTLKLGTQTGSLINHVTSAYADAAPTVSAGATILHWTDRTACTIVAVRLTKKGAPKEVDVRRDVATRTDANGMSDCQSYSYAPDPKGHIETFSLRKNGAWVRLGESLKGTRLKIGARNHFYDFSF